MELAVSEIKIQKINIKNKPEIIKFLNENLVKYDKEVTEENLLEAKNDRATLNKLKKAVEDRRKSVKKECMQPYEEVEPDFKEITDLIDKVINTTDSRIKLVEEKQNQSKLEEIIKYFDGNVGEYKELIDFDKIFNEQWLNKSYTMKKVQLDIDHIFSKTNMDLATINGQFKEENIRVQVKDFYFKNINQSSVLSLAIQEGTRLSESIKKITETENLNTKEEVNVTNSIQNVSETKKVGRVFKITCTYEKLKELNNFLITSGGYITDVLERFEVQENGR